MNIQEHAFLYISRLKNGVGEQQPSNPDTQSVSRKSVSFFALRRLLRWGKGRFAVQKYPVRDSGHHEQESSQTT